MKIAISGATGFIGTHLTAHLTGLGHRAVPLGRPAFRSQESLAAALAGRGEVTLEALAGSELILMEKNVPYNRKFESLLAQHNVACEPFLRLPSASAARELLLDGPFVSLLPWYTVRADVEAGRLCLLHIPAWELTQSVQMVLHRSKVITPQIEGFLTELSGALDAVLA